VIWLKKSLSMGLESAIPVYVVSSGFSPEFTAEIHAMRHSLYRFVIIYTGFRKVDGFVSMAV
jgi:hypothetical protein